MKIKTTTSFASVISIVSIIDTIYFLHDWKGLDELYNAMTLHTELMRARKFYF